MSHHGGDFVYFEDHKHEEHAEHKKKRRFVDEEDWGDDVSVIDQENEVEWGVVIFKLFLAVIFVGFAVGCIVYSIIASELQQSSPTRNPNYYPYDVNEQALTGTWTVVTRTAYGNDTPADHVVNTFSIDWYQDSAKKRLYSRVGVPPDDWVHTNYVYQNYSYYVRPTRCVKSPVGYDEFLENFGLRYMGLKREEALNINGHEKDVNVYEGEPPMDADVDGFRPSLIRGYAEKDRSVGYGWEVYFPHSNGTSLYREEYWFPTMEHREPDWEIFDSIPDYCYNS